MDKPVSRHRKGRTVIVLSIAGLVTVAVIGVGLYGLVHGPGIGTTGVPAGSSAPVRSGQSATGAATSSLTVASPSPVATTSNPEEFTRRVAVAVFGWDTATGYTPSDYIQQVVDVGDPSGNETPGLAADLADYLPNTAAWVQLRQYQTRQWLTIDTVTVPTSWAQALQQGQGTLPPGTTAFTITGTRHRVGVWDGKPVETAEQVSFTIFETCQPTYKTCRLLRLSKLDNPLH